MAETSSGEFDWDAYRERNLDFAKTLLSTGIGDADRELTIVVRFVPNIDGLDPEAVLKALAAAEIEAGWGAAEDKFPAGIDATLTTQLDPDVLADDVERVVRVGVAAGCRPFGWRIR